MARARIFAARYLAFAGVLAVVMAWLAAPSAAQDDRLGTCPMFSATLINDCFKQWMDTHALQTEALNADCYDDPAMPSTSMVLRDASDREFANVTVIGGRDNKANIFISKYADINEKCCVGGYCGGPGFTEPKVAKWHICRAEILRSTYWRSFCAKKIRRK